MSNKATKSVQWRTPIMPGLSFEQCCDAHAKSWTRKARSCVTVVIKPLVHPESRTILCSACLRGAPND